MGGERVRIYLLLGLSLCVLSSAYDYLALVQQWPPATCSKQGRFCSTPVPKRFTIHGLWHKFNNGTNQINCIGPAFDLAKVKALIGALNTKWPNVFNTKQNQVLWQHEWEKHGRCDSSKDQRKYFQKALNLQGKNNLLKILQGAGLAPTLKTLRETRQIKAAIKNKIKVEPGLLCFDGPGGKKQLNEIVLCYKEPGLVAIDCPANMNSCLVDKIIWLPSLSSSNSTDAYSDYDYEDGNPAVADE